MRIRTLSSHTHLRRHADLAGAAASGVCLIHCLLTPVVLSLFPSLISYLPGDAWFHRVLAAGIVLLGAAAFVPGYRLHRQRPLLVLIGVGIALILTVAWSGETLGRATELGLSVSGSVMLVTAHLLNRSFCRQCHTCEESESCHTTGV
ncbi:MAG TPA: MerC domain-containing protein [Edaphobacter sp.]|nr:MerC domain-containing protein [Edaphobacter sp.]